MPDSGGVSSFMAAPRGRCVDGARGTGPIVIRGMLISRRRRVLLATLGALALAACVVLVPVLRERPRAEREWVALHAIAPAVRVGDNLMHVAGERALTFEGRDDFTPAWGQRTYDLDKLTGVWFVLAPFDSGWRGPAHSFVTFGFADSQFVSISVEARREQGERCGMLAGLMRRFELLYVIGEERDLIGQRAAFGDGPVYLYPVRATPGKQRAAFVEVVATDGRPTIRGYACPLAAVVRHRPEVCNAVAAMVSEIADAPARSCCEHGEVPRCCFEISDAA